MKVVLLVVCALLLAVSHAWMYWVGWAHGNAHGVDAARRDQVLDSPMRAVRPRTGHAVQA